MKARAIACALAVCTTAIADAAQPIYRCVGANGEVAFVQTPCDGTSEPIRVRGHPAAPTQPPAAEADTPSDPQPARPELSGEQRMAEEGNIRIREQRCMSGAAEQAWAGVTQSVQSRRNTIAHLESETYRARNNLAGATWDSGLRAQIAAESTAIATEEAGARRVQAELERACRDTADRERRELREN